MLQTAAAFGAGLVTQSTLQTSCAQAPSCRAHQDEEGTACKISVRVHTASVPSLGRPGQLVRPKLRLEATFAGISKVTEDADFVGADATEARRARRPTSRARAEAPPPKQQRPGAAAPTSSRPLGKSRSCADLRGGASAVVASADACACLWRFGDTLTFAARPRDLLHGGMTLQLHVQSGVRLGPWDVDMPHSNQDFGEVVVDLRRRVLPACVPSWSPPPCNWQHGLAPPGDDDDWRPGGGMDAELECPAAWESPALLVPLMRVSKSPLSGVEVSVVARVAISFSLNIDPQVLLKELEDAEKPLKDRFTDRFAACLRAPLTPLGVCGWEANKKVGPPAWGHGAPQRREQSMSRSRRSREEDVEPEEEAAPLEAVHL